MPKAPVTASLIASRGYIMREGGREMENHFECLWDLFRSIPSLETPGVSVLDEYYWLNKHDPNYSLCRATVNRGQDDHTDGKFNLSQKGCMEIMKLFMTKETRIFMIKKLKMFLTMRYSIQPSGCTGGPCLPFANWHSALEMKLYFQRFIHHIAGLPDFSALKFTKYNQYESLILPMQKYLEAAGVDFQFNTEVTNVLFDFKDGKKIASAIECSVKGVEKGLSLQKTILFLSQTEAVPKEPSTVIRTMRLMEMQKSVQAAAGISGKILQNRDPSFGHPEKFCSDINKTN